MVGSEDHPGVAGVLELLLVVDVVVGPTVRMRSLCSLDDAELVPLGFGLSHIHVGRLPTRDVDPEDGRLLAHVPLSTVALLPGLSRVCSSRGAPYGRGACVNSINVRKLRRCQG